MRIFWAIFVYLIGFLPWFIRLLNWCFWQTLMFFTTWWVGLPIGVERITEIWLERIHSIGVSGFDSNLYPTIRALAYLAFVIEWIIFAHITVIVLTWLLR